MYKRDFNVLSFGSEAEEEEAEDISAQSKTKGIKSSHDALSDRSLKRERAPEQDKQTAEADHQRKRAKKMEKEKAKQERNESEQEKQNKERRSAFPPPPFFFLA